MTDLATAPLAPPDTPERRAAQAAVRELRARIARLDENGLDLIFREARSHYAWSSRPVPDDLLRRLYEILRMGPTSGNGNPGRFVFVRSPEAKARLVPCLNPRNVAKVESAPVTAIVAYDPEFWRHLPFLHPHKDTRDKFVDNPVRARDDALLNGTLQGAYLLIAARALGLDTGPMSGFSRAKVDEAFFAGTSWRTNFLCNLGYADERAIFQRLPRFPFEEACRLA
ncbi:malonic semialdehyde reductase [Propylenella binzhouense]|uniref:Putative NADH dehydrogenase/NAD(P)H nitroreductase E4O86_17430 n=1 Tax=Propylenella binzhouense TaxID=2555902 RepID=A0A964T6U6_9HYPH|nr:malonic semialdehyde reductase [Propylenella binzhouense]MYZ49494.1 malonic semialdehyde reductase [Propylenella binzhouense]